jgi:hypothetical protein
VPGAECRVRCRVPGAGCRVLVQGAECWCRVLVPSAECRVPSAECLDRVRFPLAVLSACEVLQQDRCRSDGLVAQLPKTFEHLLVDEPSIVGVEDVILRFLRLDRAIRVKCANSRW